MTPKKLTNILEIIPKSVTGHGTFIYNAEATIARYGSPVRFVQSRRDG